MARMFDTDFDYKEESYTATVVISGSSDERTVTAQVPDELKDIVPEGKITVEHFNETQEPIGGTSAGAMAMSAPMIYAGTEEKQQITGEIKITTGLDFVKDVCIDTHFIDRSRFIRMAQVIATNPTTIGIGIEENTAIIVRDGVNAEVIGQSLETVIEDFQLQIQILQSSQTTSVLVYKT